MQSCKLDTIQGYNEQIQMIRDLNRRFENQEVLVSLTSFNHLVNLEIEQQNPADVSLLSMEDYRPGGSTALLDAIGISTQNLESKIRNQLEQNQASVVTIVLTDGYENASRYFSSQSIRQIIKSLESKGNWTFSFLGTERAAVDFAKEKLHFQAESALHFNKQNLRFKFGEINEKMTEYLDEKKVGRIKRNFFK